MNQECLKSEEELLMRSKWSCDVDHSPDRLRACVVSRPEKKAPTGVGGGCVLCEVCVLRVLR